MTKQEILQEFVPIWELIPIMNEIALNSHTLSVYNNKFHLIGGLPEQPQPQILDIGLFINSFLFNALLFTFF